MEKQLTSPLLDMQKEIRKDDTLVRPDFKGLQGIKEALKDLEGTSIGVLYAKKLSIENIKDKRIRKDFEEDKDAFIATITKIIDGDDDEQLTREELQTRLTFICDVYPKNELIYDWQKGDGLKTVGADTDMKTLKEDLATDIYVRLRNEPLTLSDRLSEYYKLESQAPLLGPTKNVLEQETKRLSEEKRDRVREQKLEEAERIEQERKDYLDAHPELKEPCPICGYEYADEQFEYPPRKGPAVFGPIRMHKRKPSKSYRYCPTCKIHFDNKNY